MTFLTLLDVLYAVGLLLLLVLAIGLRIRIERIQSQMDITVKMLLTWARLWGQPDSEVRAALQQILSRSLLLRQPERDLVLRVGREAGGRQRLHP